MTIKRLPGKYQGRCRAVVHGGLVYTVATDQTDSPGIADQTRATLQTIEQNLIDVGILRMRP